MSEDEIIATLAEFDGVWDALTPGEQAKVLELLVERVEFDAGTGQVAITFQQTGIKALGDGLPTSEETAA